MKIKLSNKSKAYITNFLYFWIIFFFACGIFGNLDHYDGGPPVPFNFKEGFIITSIISLFVLAHTIARKYVMDEELDELRQKEGLSYQEFNKKYGKILDML